MNITAEITGISYEPMLCKDLSEFSINQLDEAMKKGAFVLEVSKNKKVAISRWTSPKRTRSYPYARVYDTYGFLGKKITIIPFVKDEGARGDRDFIQWDTISLMSLLDVNVIIAYYNQASINPRNKDKITEQEFDLNYIEKKVKEILNYHSSALHWNLAQIDEMDIIAERAIEEYNKISKKLNVKMHSSDEIERRIEILKQGKSFFLEHSRNLAENAQNREVSTIHKAELLEANKKSKITIKNYLGGNYFFTVDEAWIDGEYIYLVEGKNTNTGYLTSESDIKDALLTMILFTNLKNVKVGNQEYKPKPVLKLTSKVGFSEANLSKGQVELLETLKVEAKENNFILDVR